jgi:cation diffusion facilitator family transporter
MTAAALLEKKQQRRLIAVLLVTSAFCGVELAGAVMAKSEVLKAEALHLLLDIGALSMSLWAMRIAQRPRSDRYSFGLRRAEPIAALVNGLLVLLAAVYIVVEGVESLSSGVAPVPGIMMVVSVLALVINGVSAYLLHGAMGHDHGHGPAHEHALLSGHHDDHSHEPPQSCAREHDHHAHETHAHDEPALAHDHDHDHDHGDHDHHEHDHSEHDHEHEHAQHEHHDHHGHADHSLNLRGAWLHLMGDALGAFAAFVTAVAIWLGAPRIVDPLASFLVAGILFVGAVRLLQDAMRVLLEAAPAHLAIADVRKTVEAAGSDVRVIDIHAWTVGAGHHALGLRVQTGATTAAAIERTIRDHYRVSQVWVHLVAGSPRRSTAPSAS